MSGKIKNSRKIKKTPTGNYDNKIEIQHCTHKYHSNINEIFNVVFIMTVKISKQTFNIL